MFFCKFSKRLLMICSLSVLCVTVSSSLYVSFAASTSKSLITHNLAKIYLLCPCLFYIIVFVIRLDLQNHILTWKNVLKTGFWIGLNQALPRWWRWSHQEPPILSFTMALQKHMGDITDTTFMFYTWFALWSFSEIFFKCLFKIKSENCKWHSGWLIDWLIDITFRNVCTSTCLLAKACLIVRPTYFFALDFVR